MSILSYVKHHAVVTTVTTLGVVIIAIIAGRAATMQPPIEVVPAAKAVTTVSAATFRNGTSTVMVQGTVESHNQAELKSQLSAPVAVIHAGVGSTVDAGQIIVELQNADIRAQLESARASLVLAQGQYGTSRQDAVDKVRGAYIQAESVLRTQIDPLISSKVGEPAPIVQYREISKSGQQLSDRIRTNRSRLISASTEWKDAIDSLSTDSSDARIHEVIVMSQEHLTLMSVLLGDIATVFNDALRATVPENVPFLYEYQEIVDTARTSINTATASLTSAETSLSANTRGSAAAAGVSVAEAGVHNLEAQLAKTIIRSPITGKISVLPLKVGEFAAPGELIATVVGGGGLQVRAFASSEDFSRIIVGAPAVIGGRAQGTVSAVAPSVNAATKKAEVNIEILNPAQSGLVVGDTVQASIETGRSSSGISGSALYVVPIQNIKITPGAAAVFTVDANATIRRNEVILGQIRGDFVEVIAGLSDDMNIVSPVYELEEGQTVTVE